MLSVPVQGPARERANTSPCAGIVGAGIAGLSAAIALRRAGWDVEIFERSQFKNEIGAAISLPSNAARVLDHWQFDLQKAAPVPNQSVRLVSADQLATISQEDYPDIAAQLGHACWSFHRVDLHRGLRDLATDPAVQDGTFGCSVEIRLGCEAVGVDCNLGKIQLADGRAVVKDLVVIADGAHSRLVGSLIGHEPQLQVAGRSIYRWLVPMSDVLAHSEARKLYVDELPGFLNLQDPAKGVFWISYTCRGGDILNNAVVHRTQAGEGDQDLWHSPVSKEQVLSVLSNFHPSAKSIVNMASEDGIKAHHLFTRPPLASFVRGRAVVVGDAAHAMLPTHAAGGAIAVESAATLEVLFKGVDGADEAVVSQRLQLFDKLRIPRCNLTMLVSNAGPQALDNPSVIKEVRRFYSGPLPEQGSQPWGAQFRELLFHHDEYRAAELALAEAPLLENGGA
ncbi:hypothetical protein B0T26DRAFT_659249 [Lasiosphaeria miniovina]|uniref:FAD-binding domain-containing protein n=1 Tax=Lasiosphaeria miniovina TaxID=1954250 RepID=A0AA39ZSP5_9PEZI|nr:uncharacterized protein B0T26DRAFT_659249 [Lasiosphaeria miniovina]KAK0702961.1 hypothetical protein B0T26DRAFT_659249 [Lasiosphaeria miniovina]